MVRAKRKINQFTNYSNNYLMDIQTAKQIRIADYLHSLGYSPVKQQGINLWYKSPLREETEASFKVNIEVTNGMILHSAKAAAPSNWRHTYMLPTIYLIYWNA